MPTGRPAKYTLKYVNEEADRLLKFFKNKTTIFLKEFAVYRGYSRQRLSEFGKISPKFSDALKVCKDIQEMRIATGALKGKYNASFAIFALKNVAGWRDKQEVDHSGGLNVTITNYGHKTAP